MSQDLLSFLDEPSPSAQPGHDPHITSSVEVGKIPESQHDAIFPRVGQNGTELDAGSTNTGAGNQNLFNDANDDEDDFGDFEDASSAGQPSITVPLAPDCQRSLPKPKPQTKEVRSPFPPKVPKAASKPAPSAPSKPPPKKDSVGSHPFAGRMDLLFENDDYDAGADELGDLANNPEAAMAYSKRLIAEQQDRTTVSAKGKAAAGQQGGFIDMNESRQPDPGKAKPEKKKDPNVLFDADDSFEEDEEEADDFGDFETWNGPAVPARPTNPAAPAPPTTAMDLLGLDDETPERAKQQSAQTRLTNRKTSNKNDQLKSRHSTKTQSPPEDDVWDDFETSAPASSQPHVQSRGPQQDDTWPDVDANAPSPPTPPPTQPNTKSSPTKPISAPTQQLPPTNIPPPIILLSIFPSIFRSADEALFTAMGKLDLKSRTMLLSHPASHQFLRGYLAQGVVLARIIAGRKLRWKRDQRLSQGMRIGPATAGGKGGMKLAGLDKSEVAKEEREVVDVVGLYRAQVGKLRSAVTAASQAPGLPRLPGVTEIGEVMPVRALKQGEGGITAREACALCGLKREERMVRVDEGVEDSFGEWWVQGLSMHVGCRDFWEEHERKLKSR